MFKETQMFKRIKEIRNGLKLYTEEELCECFYSNYYVEGKDTDIPKWRKVWIRVSVLVVYLTGWYSIRWRVSRFICGKLGHKMQDLSHGGPESGNVYVVCKRCHEVLVDEILY
jgi:hypothetical protein